MELSELKMKLNEVIQSMYNQGIMDYQFAQIQALQNAKNPNFVAEVITSYCKGAETIILELHKILAQQDVYFCSIDEYIHQLKGSSSSIGANGMQLACSDIHESSNDRNKKGCLQALNRMILEYCILQGKLQTVVQAIFDIKTKQQLQEAKNSVEST